MRKLALLLVVLLGVAHFATVIHCEDDVAEEVEGESEDSDGEDSDDEGDLEEEEDEEDGGTEVKEENGVLILTEKNFETFMEGKDTVLIEFYAPWCGHCKQFAPEYEKIAEALKEHDPPIPVAKIDAAKHRALGSQFEVQGYPTIKIFKNGVPVAYEEARTKKAIVARVKEVSHPDWKPPPDATLVLTKENFDEVVNNAEIILVEFYAPWCGHCKKLAPEYESAAKMLSKREVPIPLAKVDVIAEEELGKRFEISGYPDLKLFRNGKLNKEYQGARDAAGITAYMIEQAGPPSKEVKTVKSVQDLIKDGDDVIILAVFSSEEDAALQTYLEAGNLLRDDFKFLHTFNSGVAKLLKTSAGKMVMFQPEKFRSKYEPAIQALTIKDSVEEIQEFIQKNALPLVGHRKQSNEDKRYKKRPLVVVYYGVDFSFDYRKATQFWRSKVLEVATDFPEYTFAIADEEDYKDELMDLGLAESGEEVNVAILAEGEKLYAMEPEEVDADVLRDFVMAFKKGKLKPITKSQPVPKNNNGPVKVVVGKTFDDIVMDTKKDVLIEFYAPWCGHCQKLEPEYIALGKKYKAEKNLVIAKMDATANDHPRDVFKVEGFPTIYLAPSNAKQSPIKFESGNRTLEAFSKFLEEHATQLSQRKDEL